MGPGYRDALRSYRVIIDDVKRGKLRLAEELDFEVSPGSHTVRLAIAWTGSPVVRVNVEPGEVVTLVGRPGKSGVSPIDLFGRTRWVGLQIDHDRS